MNGTTPATRSSSTEPLLEVRDLRVTFPTPRGDAFCVRGASFDVSRGEVLAIVGESGSGKSLTARSILRLVDAPGRVDAERLAFDGENLLTLREDELRAVRGGRIAMIFQDPMGSLNPTFTVGAQIVQVLRSHRDLSRRAARERAAELLRLVGIPNPVQRLDQHPHELSGGMRQRVMIAMAISCDPDLLIADEPTTALDVTIQAQILELLDDMRRQLGMAIVLITHDLGVVARLADAVAVMYAGRVVERGPAERVVFDPGHPYTRALLAASPRLRSQGHEPLSAIEGAPPEATMVPSGCSFASRCAMAVERCHVEPAGVTRLGPDHVAACWRIEAGAVAR